MLGLAEYVAASAQLSQYGLKAEETMQRALDYNLSKEKMIGLAKSVASDYYAQYQELLHDTMKEVAENAVQHYADQLGMEVPEELVDKVVKQQFKNKYYGSNLDQRLKYNHYVLQKRVDMAGRMDPKHLTTTYSQYPMFGSQTVTDQRVLLGTLSKIENDVAKEMAQRSDTPFIRWTLSHRHSVQDICDELAGNVDTDVSRYLAEKGIKISPKGLYFPNKLPDPPHPNCQCEYGMVRDTREIKPGRLERALRTVRKLLRKIQKR